MRTLFVLVATALLGAASLAPATAQEAPWEPNLRNERVYFACGESRLANLDNGGASLIGWDTTAPEASAQSGAGCGSVDSPFTQSAVPNIYDTTFSGTFTGNLDTITIETHNIYLGPGRAGGPVPVAVRLVVDGETLTPGLNGLGAFVEVTPVRPSSVIAERFRFSITNIGFVSETEDAEHDIQLVLHGGTRRNEGPTITDTANMWVYDTTEVPSGIEFNPAAPEAVSIQATRPL